MNITLRQVRAFVVVARFSSFTRAADLLHLTQPALTVQIRQLEQALGVKLFDRSTRAVELTRTGRELLPVLERLLGEFDAVVVSTREMATMRYGTVRMAALPSVAATVLPPLIARFKQRHPHIRITVRDSVGERINAMVREESFISALAAMSNRMPNWKQSPCSRMRCGLSFQRRIRLANRPRSCSAG